MYTHVIVFLFKVISLLGYFLISMNLSFSKTFNELSQNKGIKINVLKYGSITEINVHLSLVMRDDFTWDKEAYFKKAKCKCQDK